MREHNRHGVGGRKRELHEVDFSTATFAREREDELWVFARASYDLGIGRRREDCAEGCWRRGMAQTPDVLDFFGR